MAHGVGQGLRRQHQTHGNQSLLREVRDEIGILRRDRCSRNPSAGAGTGVRQTIIGASNRTNQYGGGAKPCGIPRPTPAVDHRLAICGASAPRVGHPLVELFVEEHNPAGDLIAAECREFIEIVYDDHFAR